MTTPRSAEEWAIKVAQDFPATVYFGADWQCKMADALRAFAAQETAVLQRDVDGFRRENGAQGEQIGALQRRVEALEKALAPFAREAATLRSDRQMPDGSWVGHRAVNITRDDYFRAEAALRGGETG